MYYTNTYIIFNTNVTLKILFIIVFFYNSVFWWVETEYFTPYIQLFSIRIILFAYDLQDQLLGEKR